MAINWWEIFGKQEVDGPPYYGPAEYTGNLGVVECGVCGGWGRDEFNQKCHRCDGWCYWTHPLPTRDNCQICYGLRGGVPGNENIVAGIIVCDYCSADINTGRTVKTTMRVNNFVDILLKIVNNSNVPDNEFRAIVKAIIPSINGDKSCD